MLDANLDSWLEHGCNVQDAANVKGEEGRLERPSIRQRDRQRERGHSGQLGS